MSLDVSAWTGLELVAPITEGNRNDVWRGLLDGRPVAVRESRRSVASLEWELDLIDALASIGFLVPEVVAADTGERHVDGVVVQRWVEGRPPASDDDWSAVALELGRLHLTTGTHRQRPDCCVAHELVRDRRSVDADLDALEPADQALVIDVLAGFADVRTAVIHGDPGPSNIRITADGSVGLLDWDESRVDVIWHDLSSLGVPVLTAHQQARAIDLSDAWEAVNGWVAEPAYARSRLAALRSRAATS